MHAHVHTHAAAGAASLQHHCCCTAGCTHDAPHHPAPLLHARPVGYQRTHCCCSTTLPLRRPGTRPPWIPHPPMSTCTATASPHTQHATHMSRRTHSRPTLHTCIDTHIQSYTDCTPAPKHSVLLYRHRPSNIHSNPPPRCAPGTRPPRAYACCSLSPTYRSSAVRTQIAQAKHPTPHLRRLILTYCVLTYCVPLHAAAAICACSLNCRCSGRALCQTGGGSSAASEPPKKIGAIRFF